MLREIAVLTVAWRKMEELLTYLKSMKRIFMHLRFTGCNGVVFHGFLTEDFAPAMLTGNCETQMSSSNRTLQVAACRWNDSSGLI